MDLHSIAYWVDENVEAAVKRSYQTRARAKTKTHKKQGGPVYDLRS